MRLFFAVMLPEEVQLAVSVRQKEYRTLLGESGIRWTPPEKWHITLKFLGETPEEQGVGATAAAERVCETQTPFVLAMGKIGAFPTLQQPQVVWLGADAGAEALNGLATVLDRALTAQGFPSETRPFHPHLTLARLEGSAVRTAASVLPTLAEADHASAVPTSVRSSIRFTVDRFALMQSVPHLSGSIYRLIRTFVFVV